MKGEVLFELKIEGKKWKFVSWTGYDDEWEKSKFIDEIIAIFWLSNSVSGLKSMSRFLIIWMAWENDLNLSSIVSLMQPCVEQRDWVLYS